MYGQTVRKTRKFDLRDGVSTFLRNISELPGHIGETSGNITELLIVIALGI
jgi:hypothetical protein